MELITAYLAGFVALVGMFALRAPHENLRTVFVLAVVWPVSILAIVFMVAISFVGWNFDVAKSDKMFGSRRSTNPNVRGIAVSVFGTELQFYSPRKTVDQ